MATAMKVPKAMERISVIVDAFEDAATSCTDVGIGRLVFVDVGNESWEDVDDKVSHGGEIACEADGMFTPEGEEGSTSVSFTVIVM